jgi:hypothetical protein
VKVTKKQLRKIIKEEKQRILKEYSEYASWSDLNDIFDDEMSVLEDMQQKYVFSGWLRDNDRADIDHLIRKGLNTLQKAYEIIEKETLESRKSR